MHGEVTWISDSSTLGLAFSLEVALKLDWTLQQNITTRQSFATDLLRV